MTYKLTNEARCLRSTMAMGGMPVSITVGGWWAEAKLSAIGRQAMDELVCNDLVVAEPFNQTGRMTYRPTEKALKMKPENQAFLSKYGHFKMTEPNTERKS